MDATTQLRFIGGNTLYTNAIFSLEPGTNYLMVRERYALRASNEQVYSYPYSNTLPKERWLTCESPIRLGQPLKSSNTVGSSLFKSSSTAASSVTFVFTKPESCKDFTTLDLIPMLAVYLARSYLGR